MPTEWFEPCFLVASDPAFHFGDTPRICEGLGAFLCELADSSVAESLIHLFREEWCNCPYDDPFSVETWPNPPFDLKTVLRRDLDPAQIVRANRELERASDIAWNLESEYHPMHENVALIAWSAKKLDDLWGELQHAIARYPVKGRPRFPFEGVPFQDDDGADACTNQGLDEQTVVCNEVAVVEGEAQERKLPSHGEHTRAQQSGEWSKPMSKTECARRVTGKRGSVRARDIKALWDKWEKKQHSPNQWSIRLDTLDDGTRQKLL